ncbi:TPA: hypothetical protein ACRMYO_006186 [Pseudomonas aeruginosa]|uniref:hypothetical protein n=1 Tax=Pseudomonas aeruginosa TaxID=287 RepID=UPI00053E7D8E|nr:hypothetical protein [Pseudomonas aeruginosa]ELP9629061.1 hypothetical protein [Pseudomonas aeruginosa]ELQ6364652.1 hypothetical protein [Pseudomonas aeruginosa]OFC31404.1 hypothetical protein AN464_27645 [Pseudomonas aeruginosa]POP57137.1 hypothetical protein C3L32_21735 [Pseudomonas aeruginosa]HCR1319797.1 hypothetical protein [Pseudomonas aeruginosa]
MHVFTTQVLPADVRLVRLFSMVHVVRRVPISDQISAAMGACIDQLCSTAHEDANALIGVSFSASALVTNEGEQFMVLAYAGTPALLEVAGQVDED